MLVACGINRAVGDWQAKFTWAKSKIKGNALIYVVLHLAWNACMFTIYGRKEIAGFMEGGAVLINNIM